jgi:hypothetical protein
MAGMNDLPFAPGSTYFQGATANANDGANLEGKEYWVESSRSGRYKKLRIVRNTAAAALEPKRLVTFQSGTHNGRVDGYADIHTEPCYPVDDAYSTSVAVNDLFYICVEGPCLVKTTMVAGATIVVAVGDPLVNATAVTSGATTAGRARLIDMTGATAVLGAQLHDFFGRALSAATTANTNSDILVDVRRSF